MDKHRKPVTTVILAGGRGLRIGGEKGLHLLHGKPLISWVLDAVKADSNEVLINANGAQSAYTFLGCRIIADDLPDWPGPLAGLHAALKYANADYVMTVPCDTPFLPHDLILQLVASLDQGALEASVAVVDGRRQPTIAMYKKSVLPKLLVYLETGKRKVNDWLSTLQLTEVVFSNAGQFENINTTDELVRANNKTKIAGKGIETEATE